eukprot:gene13265-13395_t
MPSAFAAACAADTSCSSAGSTTVTSSLISDPTSTMATVKDYPKAASLLGNLAETGTDVIAISASLLLPVTGYSGNRGTACLKLNDLVGDASAALQASLDTVAVVPNSASSASVTCSSSSLGKVVVVQYTPKTVQPPSTPAPSPSPSPSPSPQLGQNTSTDVYAADTSEVSAKDVATPVSYAFIFAGYDYNSIFMRGGKVDEAASEAFKLMLKKSFLIGVASKTNLTVGTANTLQVNRVNVTNIRPGSVLVDLTFWPPAAATVDDISKLASAVTSKAGDFFATPELIAAYGAPQVVGTPLITDNNPWGLSSAVTLGIGIGVGVGGALLIGVVVGVLVAKRRRVQTLSPRGQRSEA